MITVLDFVNHIGVSQSLYVTLRAIDKYNVEALDVKLGTLPGNWISADDRIPEPDPGTRIEAIRIRGIAWDGSDWEWNRVINCNACDPADVFGCLDAARADFEEALDEHNAERDAECEDDVDDLFY
jgi:hypothetical protein